MAKKKAESSESKPRPVRKAPAKKPLAAGGGAPTIDTAVAANAAAALVGHKFSSASSAAPAGAKKESGTFKQLKAGLNKPSAGAMGGAFAIPSQQKKSNLPFAGGKQVGHNQTFGADATRTGVPRRTPG